MSTELKFEVISNKFRDTLTPVQRRNEKSPILIKLLNDETVFIPITDDFKETTLNKFYEKARSAGKRLNKRKTLLKDVLGYMMWFSEKETV